MKIFQSLAVICSLFLFGEVSAQNVTYRISSVQRTATYAEFQVELQSNTPFKLGDGQVYINYNTEAFGQNAVANSRVTVTPGSVLLQTNSSSIPIYTEPIVVDNAAGRISVAWEQFLASGYLITNNITTFSSTLFEVRIDFLPGADTEPDEICFQFGGAFENQTFTACGPEAVVGLFTAPNCISSPGSRITSDIYVCPSAPLPVELLSFRAQATPEDQCELSWETATELNNDYFQIEHSNDGINFSAIGTRRGAGTTTEIQRYYFLHEVPESGINYYRLKQVDLDGNFEYSPLRSVELTGSGENALVRIFPNPAGRNSELSIVISGPPSREPVYLRLFDPFGRLVLERDLGDWTTQQFALPLPENLAASVYWLELFVGKKLAKSTKIVITD